TDGIQGLTIGAIAKAMGVSVGGLYRYFPNKEAIFVALQLHALTKLDTHVADTLGEIDGRDEPIGQVARAKLAAVFELWDQFKRIAPEHYRVLYAFSSNLDRTLDDASASQVDGYLQPILLRIAQALTECTEEGLIGDGDQLIRTYLIWATLQGLTQFEKRDHLQPMGLRAPALKVEVMRSYLSAWGAEPMTIDMVCRV
ncbi:MAG: TetR/AcrR family transcriptional regulator, partial [Myxococcota bacterium]|nr:TetR/AcrR family transcriptional regulator [Myxococcota bacterium]